MTLSTIFLHTLVTFLSLSHPIAIAQRPPTPENTTLVNSTKFPGASISYKETQICETTPGVKGYSGFVNLPPAPEQGRNYEIHTWFWFFEARQSPETAPLSLWFNGGPGSPSSPAAVGENGPCKVLENSRDTELNQWAWNDRVNMLYIDQPVQTGFSYDVLIDGAINEVKSPFAISSSSTVNSTVLSGTFTSQNSTRAPTSTSSVAPAIWDFLQVWIQEAPFKNAKNNTISIWTESYGGHYGPTFANYFQTQTDRITSGELSSQTFTPIKIDTLGLINACIDTTTQVPLYPVMANNNTYGIKLLNDSQYAEATAAIPTCLNLTTTCRSTAASLDPQGWGNNTEVNTACLNAYMYCFGKVAVEDAAGNLPSGVYHFDIGSPQIASFPPKWAAGYLNTPEVQQALGVPLNWTGYSAVIATGFLTAGDFIKGDNLDILGNLLDKGVKVALMYGDRDYQCNWLGGEAISLAIDSQSSSGFNGSGYADIRTNSSYVGGLVRQHGNLSFSRVYQAGHEVPYYQPETAYQIFNRVMFNQDVATGQVALNSTYATTGSSSAITTQEIIPYNTQVDCYFWDIFETCTPAQAAMFSNGSAITRDFVMVGYKLADGTEVMYPQHQGNGTSGSGTSTSSAPGATASTSGARGRYPRFFWRR